MKSRFWNDKASREEMESGVVVFDKRRKEVVMGLVLTGYLNTKDVREPVTYAHTYGDKESFWMVSHTLSVAGEKTCEGAGKLTDLT